MSSSTSPDAQSPTSTSPASGQNGNSEPRSESRGSNGAPTNGFRSRNGDENGRSRGGFREELDTRPQDMQVTHVTNPQSQCQKVYIMANFMEMKMRTDQTVYQYRVEYEPEVESVRMRTILLKRAARERLQDIYVFDGVSELRSYTDLGPDDAHFTCTDSGTGNQEFFNIKVKKTGICNLVPAEMIRLYNMHMKSFFIRHLGYKQISAIAGYVHPDSLTPVGQDLFIMRGFRTSANLHENDKLLVCLESVHKLAQKRNVLEHFRLLRNNMRGAGDFKEAIKQQYIGKLVMTSYDHSIYRVDDVDFTKNPMCTFHDRKKNADVTFVDYFKNKWRVEIEDKAQPLLVGTPSTQRKGDRSEKERDKIVNLIPELCNMAGLTEQQRNDNRLKNELIRASQVVPADRVKHLTELMHQLNSNEKIKETLTKWNYSFGTEPLKITGRLLQPEKVAFSRTVNQHSSTWQKVDHMASFENPLLREKLAIPPPQFERMLVIFPRRNENQKMDIMKKLQTGFSGIGLKPDNVEVKMIDRDDPSHYVQAIRAMPQNTTAAMIVMDRQNKERYDAIKKCCAVDRGLVSQVVTLKLLSDERKARGAATKIAIQVAAKVNGEPWHIDLPLKESMICGYDTYHDTAARGRSFGAFVASLNPKFSRWYSKSDQHSHQEELSINLAKNLDEALRRYRNFPGNEGKLPARVVLYRDGVSDGDLEYVVHTELRHIKDVLKKAVTGTEVEKIRLCFIVVNKSIGTRFFAYINKQFVNPQPGTIIDDHVTRKHRYDFYLVSQSTRQGTVAPTYYNVLYDDSGLSVERMQMMTYKLCLGYYNWAGTVRVPAPCQYAHKLAYLCGEHLHQSPNMSLDDNLHYL